MKKSETIYKHFFTSYNVHANDAIDQCSVSNGTDRTTRTNVPLRVMASRIWSSKRKTSAAKRLG